MTSVRHSSRNVVAVSMILAATALYFGQGCTPPPPPPAPLPGSRTIDFVDTTDAVVGSTGLLRVILIDVVAEDTEVALSSSNPAIAAVPVTAVVIAGSDTAEVPYDALASGTALITAELDGSVGTSSVDVVSELRVSFFSTPERLQTGAAGLLSVGTNITVPAGTTISLSSSNAGVLGVPASVTIEPFSSSQSVPIVAGNPGAATLTASLAASSQTSIVTVTGTLAIDGLFGIPDRAVIGTPFEATIELDAIAASNTTITLTSTNPGVVAVPGSATVLAGSSSVDVPLRATGLGSTQITAELAGTSRSVFVLVVATSSLEFINGPTDMLVGTTDELGLFLDAAAPGPVTVTLSSSNPAVLSVPATAVFPPGITSANVAISALAPGQAVITATDPGGFSKILVVNVVAAPSITNISFSGPLQTGAVETLNVSLDVPPTAATTVILTSSNPVVLSVPATVVFPAGETSFSTALVAGSPGSTVLTATLGASVASTSVTVVGSVFIAFASASTSRLEVGATASASVSLNAGVAADTLITIVNSNPAALAVQSTVLVPVGNTFASVAVAALAPGTATLTFSIPGSSFSTSFEVVSDPTTLSVPATASVRVGFADTLFLSVDAAVATDLVIDLANANPAVVSVPPTVVIPAGDSNASVSFVGLAVGGPVNITASIPSIPAIPPSVIAITVLP